jgi:translation initiation factor 3 subunit D|eukprot:SAG25_NODE_364_length_9141_cov_5.390732_5_plen_536_part_00
MAAFLPIDVVDNETGWGPAAAPPELFTDVPYLSFSKADKLGKAADWTYNQRFRGGQPKEKDADEFQVVDTKAQYKEKKFGPRFRGRRRQYEKDTGPEKNSNQRPQRSRREREMMARRQSAGHWKRVDNAALTVYESSVEVKPSWEVIEQLDLKAMMKLKVAAQNIPEPEDVKWCGALSYYNKTFDRLTTRAPVKLQSFEHLTFHAATTTDDPVIRAQTRTSDANVFATDAVLACIATAPRSVYSWDLVFHRIGDKVFIDKRDDSQFDFETVNETAHEPPSTDDPGHINSMQSLSQEATAINQNFSQQLMQKPDGKEALTFPEGNPFKTSKEEVGSVAYRYRKWKLNENTTMLVRCQVNGVVEPKKEGDPQKYLTCMALNEFDPKETGVDWRRKLDTQRGAVLANELKNNSNKLGRWTARSFLAGADLMQLGFVTRANQNFNQKAAHQILTAPTYKPQEFARQINLDPSNMWGIIQYIITLVQKQPSPGKYVLLKDPNKKILWLYKVPANTFDEDSDEDSSEEESDEDDEDDEDDE